MNRECKGRNIVNSTIRIGENHRRVITLTLVLLEQKLFEIMEWVEGRQKVGALYWEKNCLTLAQVNTLRQEIEAVRNILMSIKDNLGLVASAHDAVSAIRGACYAVIDPLVELGGKYLKAYGEPSQELVSFLEPRIEEVVVHMNRILSTVWTAERTK